jgi:hypothetical protein
MNSARRWFKSRANKPTTQYRRVSGYERNNLPFDSTQYVVVVWKSDREKKVKPLLKSDCFGKNCSRITKKKKEKQVTAKNHVTKPSAIVKVSKPEVNLIHESQFTARASETHAPFVTFAWLLIGNFVIHHHRLSILFTLSFRLVFNAEPQNFSLNLWSRMFQGESRPGSIGDVAKV